MPGVVQAGIASKIPLQGGSNGGILVRDQVFDPKHQQYLVEYSFVDEGYHGAIGIPFLAGRGFTQQDMDAASVMADRKIGTAVVVRAGKLAGIVTATDVCRALADALESRFGKPDSTDAA